MLVPDPIEKPSQPDDRSFERGGRPPGVGRLHSLHWAVIVLSLVVTVTASYFAAQQLDDKIEMRFQREVEQVVALISERMKRYEDALWGSVSAIQAHGGSMSYEDWVVFTKHLRIEAKYPGIDGIGVVYYVPRERRSQFVDEQRRSRPRFQIHPNRDAGEYWPITVVEPLSSNGAAVGLDLAYEENRHAAAKLARDTGVARGTAPIALVQEETPTPGFLLFAPFYRGGEYDTVAKRRENIVGLVYASFVVRKLMAGTLHKDRRHVGIRIADGDAVIYDEHLDIEEDFDPDSRYRATVPVRMYGREWAFDIRSGKEFQQLTASSQPLVVLFCGLFIDLLLFLLFLSLSRAKGRAVTYARAVNETLRERTKRLERSNADLEKFAYVASHDLKTPLRGIGALAEYLSEDLAAYTGSAEANPDVGKNLKRIGMQVRRMDSLIKGILAYSSASADQAEEGEVDVAELVRQVREDLGLDERQCAIEGVLPKLFADSTQIRQILTNLIGNAVKHHHDPARAVVKISAARTDRSYVLSVSDNGPGIDPRFQSRVFEAFNTLGSKEKADSTGIGLSIVKKIMDSCGGNVRVESELGRGATFVLTFPVRAAVGVR